MRVHVNGKPMTLPEEATVRDLLASLDLLEIRAAVEVNKELVVKTEWETAKLKENDRVEIVTFVGGG